MGGQWDNSKPISVSVAPDGVAWDSGTNILNSQLDAEFGNTSWQNTIATAIQTWAVAANLNFTTSPDGNYAFNSVGANQGDPDFGDIRVAGFNFPTKEIALTYGPPPNGWTAAGDVKLNTDYTFGTTGQWDLETVLIHELGHSLGLGESPQPSSVMYTYYSGVRHDLSNFDVEGIQSLYGPRVADQFQSQGQASSTGSAVDLSGNLNAAGIAVVNGLSLNSIGDSEYFSVTAPANQQGATLMVNAVANGHSLLSPKVTVIEALTGATLAANSHTDQYGDTASVSIPNAQAGHRYFIVVTGAAQNVFAVGNYSLQVGFSGGTIASPTMPITTTPTVPTTPTPTPPTTTTPIATTPATPITTTKPVATPDRYAANTSFAAAAELGVISGQSIISGVTLPTGQDVRVFTFEPASPGLVFVASANATIMVGNSSGQVVASGRGLIGFAAPQAGARYFVIVMSPTSTPVVDASFAVQVVPVAAAPAAVAPVTVGQAVPSGTTTTTSVTSTTKAKKKHRHR